MTALQIETENEKAMHLILKIINKNYLPSKILFYTEIGEYPGISKIKIYGYNKPEGLQKIFKLSNGERKEILKENYSFNEQKGIIIFENNLPLSEDTILIFI